MFHDNTNNEVKMATSNDEVRFVRLKPYDKKRGYLVRRYSIRGHEFLTDNESKRPVWNRVSKKAAEFLKTLKQDQSDPDSRDLLDVCTQEEYEAIREREQAAFLTQLGVEAPVRAAAPAVPPTIDRVGGRAAAIPDLGDVVPMGTGVSDPSRPARAAEEPAPAAAVTAALDESPPATAGAPTEPEDASSSPEGEPSASASEAGSTAPSARRGRASRASE